MRGSATVATAAVMRSWKSKTSSSAPSRRLRPELRAALAVDELGGDPEPVAAPAHRALEQIAHAELGRDLADVGRAALVGQRRAQGDDGEAAEAAEGGDDLGDDAVGEPGAVRVAAEVGEGQDREPRDARDRRQRLAPRREQAVADPRHGQDPVLPAVRGGERLAQAGDLHGEVALLDEAAGPGAGEEVLLGDGAAGRLGEGGEHGEGALAEGDGGAGAGQDAAGGVEHERAKGERCVGHARA